MYKYAINRLLGMIPILLVVSVLVFFYVHALPGDPAMMLMEELDMEEVKMIRDELGLNRPLYVQYFEFAKGIFRFDFGNSALTGEPVSKEIASRLIPTLELTIASLAWSILIGLVVGVFSAINRNQWQDHLGIFASISGLSMPNFWLGLLLIELFAVSLGWLPTAGYGTWQHLLLPSFTLGTGLSAIIARFSRSSLMDVLREDYIRTARAKGLLEKTVISKHALKNSMIPVVTVIGLQCGQLLAGAIVVETVFSWPGLGRLLIDAIRHRDYNVIQAEMLLFSFQYILINLIVDLLYGVMNPQINYRKHKEK